ncbi:MAG: DnaD domain protein, partial [Bacilli bacterium]
MKTSNLLNVLKMGTINIPLYIYKECKKLNIDEKELIFLMYLNNFGVKAPFDLQNIVSDMSMNMEDVMNMISNLSDKKLLSVEVIKSDKNIMEEFVNLELFYNKLSSFLVDDVNNTTVKTNIFEIIEHEFARGLSPMEYEIIKAWFDNNTSEELIIEALKEAVYNGVSNLRYIDKILYEWNKLGFKNKEDVEKSRIKFKEKEKKEKIDVFEYNWLEDDE